MLDNLLDIEVAYSLLRGGSDDSSKDPIDVNYEKLKTDIKVTSPASPSASVLTESSGPELRGVASCQLLLLVVLNLPASWLLMMGQD